MRAGWLAPVTLRGDVAILAPLAREHAGGLREAVRDGELWRLWYTSVPAPDEMNAEIERRLALQRDGSMVPFVVIERTSGEPVGMTTYMNVDLEHRRLEIGSTWYRTRVQRTALNSECKLMLLKHAFEALECVAVEFRTSTFNVASRRAIERLGAHLDGVLRNHMRHADGTLRDTCVYSIVASEWPAVKAKLQFRLLG